MLAGPQHVDNSHRRQFGSAGVRLTTDIEDSVAGGVCLLVTVANGSSPLAGFSDALAGHRMFGRPMLCKQLVVR
jgi:hypothetical protein